MTICVFCASNDQVSDLFRSEARAIGRFIAEEGHTLVYGGATGGLMDVVAKTVMELQGNVIGVVPTLIVEKGRKSDNLSQLIEVNSLSERKELMKKLSDLFVVLPGGFGTFDELFDTVASGMLGYHNGTTLVVNTDNYFAGTLAQIDRMEQEHIGYNARKNRVRFFPSAQACIKHITNKYYTTNC
ncbi:MAG: TIGR00730 family Rossman fold protein [Prevotellaceae bacterium]|jgi:uncharacterized protein (TIGR00730 family)|nr:TIGR00730 family Rossman fold protein [Prevotellaceae bacterium]